MLAMRLSRHPFSERDRYREQAHSYIDKFGYDLHSYPHEFLWLLPPKSSVIQIASQLTHNNKERLRYDFSARPNSVQPHAALSNFLHSPRDARHLRAVLITRIFPFRRTSHEKTRPVHR